MERRTRIALADDDVLLREGLATLLERSGCDVVGQAGDAPSLLALVRAQRPDLAIIDIRMPPRHAADGLDAAVQIRAELPDVGILLLSAHAEAEQAVRLLNGGERVGYLLKSRVIDVSGFVDTVERIARGQTVIDPALVGELLAARRRDDPLEELTPRELEVLGLMAEGLSNGGIGRRLEVREGTIEKHVHSILTKLALSATEDDHRRVLAVIAYLKAR